MAKKFDKVTAFNLADEASPGVPKFANIDEVIAAAEAQAKYLNEDEAPDWRCPYDKQDCTQECWCFGAARLEQTVKDEEWTVWSSYCDNFEFNGEKKDKPK